MSSTKFRMTERLSKWAAHVFLCVRLSQYLDSRAAGRLVTKSVAGDRPKVSNFASLQSVITARTNVRDGGATSATSEL
jgi:hypothetical protein